MGTNKSSLACMSTVLGLPVSTEHWMTSHPCLRTPGGSQSLCECLTQDKDWFISVPLQPAGGVLSLNTAGGWCQRVALEHGTLLLSHRSSPHMKKLHLGHCHGNGKLCQCPLFPPPMATVFHTGNSKKTPSASVCSPLFYKMTRTRASGQL